MTGRVLVVLWTLGLAAACSLSDGWHAADLPVPPDAEAGVDGADAGAEDGSFDGLG